MSDDVKLGRPSTFTHEIAQTICERIASGESVRQICRDESMPARSSVYKWLLDDKAFADQYALAMNLRADDMFDEIFEIADDASNDWMERQSRDGETTGWQVNGDHIQRSRLMVDTRKWALGRMSPQKYGDKVSLNHGGQADNPVEVVTTYALPQNGRDAD